MSAEDALKKYYARQMGSEKRRRKGRKNGKPEKELERSVLQWASSQGIFLHVVEAKAVFSEKAQRYLRGQAEAGLPDLIGNHGSLSVWIELKAKGRRSTLKEHQREFLVAKIEQGCFACCVDSVEMLESLLVSFLSTGTSDRQLLLLNALPAKRNLPFEAADEVFF